MYFLIFIKLSCFWKTQCFHIVTITSDVKSDRLLETLNPVQEGGLFRTLGRAWKYRKCIEERRAAKRFLGPYTPGTKREGG